MKRTTLPLLLAATLIVAAACSDDDDEPAQVESIVDDTGSQPNDEESTGTTDEESTSDDQAEATDAGGEALGSARSQLRADPNDSRMVPLRIDVVSLERHDDLVELEMVLTNESEPTADAPIFEPWSSFVDDVGGANARTDLSGVGLVDQNEQKLYLPVYDSEDRCLCSSDLANLAVAPGESATLTATYGGVPNDVETLDVHVPEFPIIAGIEVRG